MIYTNLRTFYSFRSSVEMLCHDYKIKTIWLISLENDMHKSKATWKRYISPRWQLLEKK